MLIPTGHVNHYTISLIAEFHASRFKHQLFKCKIICWDTELYLQVHFAIFSITEIFFQWHYLHFHRWIEWTAQGQVAYYWIVRVLCCHFRVWAISPIASIIITKRKTNLIKVNHCCPCFPFTKHGFLVLRLNPLLKMAFPETL